MTAGGYPIRPSILRPARDGAIVALLALAVAHALELTQVGVDAHAYWAVDPADPYAHTRPGEFGAFFYAPVAAQLLAPFQALPWPLFAAAWSLVLAAALVWQAGLWTAFALLLLPVFAEVAAGNIHLLLGVAVIVGFRWPAAWAFVLLTKVTPGIGLLWFAVRREWRSLAIALCATIALAGASFAFAPDLWSRWIEVLTAAAGAEEWPFTVQVPLPIRLAAAAALVIWGARTDRRWTVPAGATLALPVLWVNGLAMLVAAMPLIATRVGETPASRWLAARARAA